MARTAMTREQLIKDIKRLQRIANRREASFEEWGHNDRIVSKQFETARTRLANLGIEQKNKRFQVGRLDKLDYQTLRKVRKVFGSKAAGYRGISVNKITTKKGYYAYANARAKKSVAGFISQNITSPTEADETKVSSALNLLTDTYKKYGGLQIDSDMIQLVMNANESGVSNKTLNKYIQWIDSYLPSDKTSATGKEKFSISRASKRTDVMKSLIDYTLHPEALAMDGYEDIEEAFLDMV